MVYKTPATDRAGNKKQKVAPALVIQRGGGSGLGNKPNRRASYGGGHAGTQF